MNFNPSTVAYGAAAVGALLVAIGALPVKPWLYLAGGLVAVGVFTAPAVPDTAGA